MVTFTFYIACKVTNFLRHPTPVDRGFFRRKFPISQHFDGIWQYNRLSDRWNYSDFEQ